MKLWKVLGLAGIAGVAAGGVVVARGERRREAYAPDDVRARLHQRHAEAIAAPEGPEATAGDAIAGDEITPDRAPGCLRAPVTWLRARRGR